MEEKEQHVQRQGVASHPRLAQCDRKVTAEEAGEGQILKDLNRFVKSVGFLRRHTGEPLKSVREGSNRIQFAFQKGHSGQKFRGSNLQAPRSHKPTPQGRKSRADPRENKMRRLGRIPKACGIMDLSPEMAL